MNLQIFWNQQLGFPVLTLLIFLPVAGALSLWMRKDARGARVEALIVSLVVLALSLLLFFKFASGVPAMQFVESIPWIAPLGIGYHIGIDGVSLFLVILTALLTVLTLIYSWDRVREHLREYLICLLILEATMIGVFVSLDLVLFFVFWEVMLIPMYFLIKTWGNGPRREYAALKYVVYNLTGSVLMLVGFIILYLNYHDWAVQIHGLEPYSFDYQKLLSAPVAFDKQLWVFGLVFLGFAVKGPIFPFHTWLPEAMLEGPIAVSVMLSGVKLGSYGLLRFNLPLTPDAAQAAVPLMMALALIGLLYGAFIALSQPNLMTMMAYAGISHLGFVTVGLFALNQIGIEGALLQMVNLGVAGAGLIFVVGFLLDRRGSLNMDDYGGLAKKAPLLAALFLIIVLASLALPGTNVFVGEFMILVGAFKSGPLYAVIGVIAVILGAAYLLWMYERIMLGKIEKAEIAVLPDLNVREAMIAGTMVVLILWIGLYPAPLLSRMEPSVRAVVDRVEKRELPLNPFVQYDPNNPHAYLLKMLADPGAAAGLPEMNAAQGSVK
ncbi:MAG TPA: NADH-quinone oxidoreductase subunit M [Nitrospiria bacterium]|nr:NADH-quinone oxidoreductase subunit M [Nitrospiria bacterium]